jgi:hemerythrin
MYYHFTADCHTGIAQIDEEHRRLFDLVNQAHGMLESASVTLSDVRELVDELKAYAHTHFEHEEAYMKETNDPELPRQRKEHMNFFAKVNNMYEELGELNEETAPAKVGEILEFLAKWLYRHIISSDMMIGKLAPIAKAASEDKDRSFVKFTDKYRTGIAFVDREHAKLFEIVERCFEIVYEDVDGDRYDEIMIILGELRDYTEMHFSEEEEYMQRIGYEGYEAQRRAHEAFVDRVREVNPYDVDENQREYLIETVNFLLGWLQDHILMSDKLIPVVAGAESE